MLKSYLAVMTGGAIGVAVRMFLTNWMTLRYGPDFPWGTILVNVSGCFIIGLFTSLTGPEGAFPASPLVRQVVTVGILGGFTTFSSFSLQTIKLFSEGQSSAAVGNVALSLTFCLAGTWLGLWVGSRS